MFALVSLNPSRRLCALLFVVALFSPPVLRAQNAAPRSSPTPAPAAQAPALNSRTPSDVVRDFYKALYERRFRDAFAMSVLRPAFEALGPAEFEELRADFEAMATTANVAVVGEQISGDMADVFIRTSGANSSEQPVIVNLFREGGAWVVGKREEQEAVRRDARNFFFNARIETHHEEVKAILQRIAAAQFAYSAQNGGLFADLQTLIQQNLVPAGSVAPETTGYRYTLNLARDRRRYHVTAEPLRYGRTGRLSFHMEQNTIRSRDTGGRPYRP